LAVVRLSYAMKAGTLACKSSRAVNEPLPYPPRSWLEPRITVRVAERRPGHIRDRPDRRGRGGDLLERHGSCDPNLGWTTP